MNLVVIYTTAFSTADAVLRYLKQKGYDAVALDSPPAGKRMVADPASCAICEFVSPLAYVAVPPEQETAARQALNDFVVPSARRIAMICEMLRFQVLVASVVTMVVALVMMMENTFDLYFPILYAVWLGTFIFVANLGRINSVLTRQRMFRMWQRPPGE